MLLTDFLSDTAARLPDKPAAVFPGGERMSFAELDRAAAQVASRLHARGIGPGQRVAILHENALDALVWFWGILRAGAATVDVPNLAGTPAIATMLAEAEPAALVIGARQLPKLGPAAIEAMPSLLLGDASVKPPAGRELVTLADIRATDTPLATRPAVAPDDVALIIYTSGTTGRPKGVMLSHANLHANVVAFNSRIGLDDGDSLLVVVPLHFIHGRIQLLTHALVGGTLYFSAGFQFPKTVLDELVAHRTTGISGVPYHFVTLLAQTKIASTPLPDLRNVTITGGAMSPTGLRQLQDALPQVRIHVNYGQTESSPRLTYLGPSEIFERVGSCGKALPGVTIEILGEDGNAVPTGEVGEVVATSPGIMKGYVSGDERSSGRIDDRGRLHTGDLGRLDADGYLYLAGRSSEMIKCAGERIFPREIEEVLDAIEGVAESAVLGVPDPVLGERLVACLVLKPGASVSASDVRAHCLKSMPLVRTPRELRFLDALPKTSSGKLTRRALLELFTSST